MWGALDSWRRTLRARRRPLVRDLLLLLLGVVLLPLLLLRRVLLRLLLLLLHGFGRRCAVGSRGSGLGGSRVGGLGVGVLRVLRRRRLLHTPHPTSASRQNSLGKRSERHGDLTWRWPARSVGAICWSTRTASSAVVARIPCGPATIPCGPSCICICCCAT